MALNVVFMGSPDFALSALKAIIDTGHRVVAIYSQPPRPRGRGQDDRPTPVHAFGLKSGIACLTPQSLKGPEACTHLAGFNPDVIVVVAYGLLLPPSILRIPPLGCLNLHASLLPRWRGAAPIQRAIMAGDTSTAAQVMRMEAGLDTGPVALSETLSIGANETAGELHDRLAAIGGPLMARALDRLAEGTLTFTRQAQEGVGYAAKIDKTEAQIDFHKPALHVHRCIRGLSPTPGAWFEAQNPATGQIERIKALGSQMAEGRDVGENLGQPGEILAIDGPGVRVACGPGSGSIVLTQLQRPGRKPVRAHEFVNGFPLPAGSRLGA